MKRLALFAIFQCLGITAFCQSHAITSRTAPTPPDKPPFFQPLFDFDGSRFDQSYLSTKSSQTSSCNGQNGTQKLSEAQTDTNQIFHVPCLNLDTFAEVAQTNLAASPFSGGQWPKAKGLPIPTQWPDAKVEQIPTTWPSLKMLRISADDPRPASQK